MIRKKRSRAERRKAKEKAKKQQMNSLTTFEGRKQFVQSKGLTNLVTRFKKGKGIKRNESKKTGEDIHLIHTDRTLHNYAGSWSRFASFVASITTAEDLEALDKSNDIEGWIDLVNQYLEHCKKLGLSAPTQSTYKPAIICFFRHPVVIRLQTIILFVGSISNICCNKSSRRYT